MSLELSKWSGDLAISRTHLGMKKIYIHIHTYTHMKIYILQEIGNKSLYVTPVVGNPQNSDLFLPTLMV